MRFTRKGYGRLHRGDDSFVSQHVVPEEAYERAATEGPGRYMYHPAPIQIDVPAQPEPPVPEPEPPVEPEPDPEPPAPEPEPEPEPDPEPPVTPPSGLPTRLLRAGNLVHRRTFRVPQVVGYDADTLAYTGHAMAYCRERNSLFVAGMATTTKAAEISIPASGRATLMQAPFDIGAGIVGNLGDVPITNEKRLGGLLVLSGDLLANFFAFYDGSGEAKRSMARGSLTLGKMSGPYRMKPASATWWNGYPGPVARYMGHIPPEWQSVLGGRAFTGGSTGITSIAGLQSNGPAFAVFDQVRADAACQMLLGYPVDAPLSRPDARSDLWNFTSSPAGAVFPEGTASVLFIGAHGTGPYSYPPAAPPYRAQVWAYSAHDLLAVKRGERTPQSLRPYDVWTLPMGEIAATGICGACIDGQTVYVMQRMADATLPIVHVYEVV